MINIGSVDGLRTPEMETYSYSTSKAAVHQLTRHLARHLAGLRERRHHLLRQLARSFGSASGRVTAAAQGGDLSGGAGPTTRNAARSRSALAVERRRDRARSLLVGLCVFLARHGQQVCHRLQTTHHLSRPGMPLLPGISDSRCGVTRPPCPQQLAGLKVHARQAILQPLARVPQACRRRMQLRHNNFHRSTHPANPRS